MPTTEQRKKKLIEKLKELFQLDQPELDFGFYKIMHAKSKQVSEFLEKDLLNIISGSFETVDEAKRVKLREQYEAALKQAREYGAPDPENTPAVKKARTALEGALSSADVEADIYDHLFRFFERYYESGDFTSRRYYARETADKAAPFAIPYNGEEVKLVWANYDQYYIKTSEYFTNYTFDLNNIDEVTARRSEDNNTLFGAQNENKPLRVHFKIIDATEGEHGNIKAADNAKRFFIPHKKNPVEIDENNELNIFFEYRPDPDKTGQEGMWQKKLNEDAVKLIIDALKDKFSKNDFIEYLKIPAPTETQKDRILLEKYLTKYTTRNTSDYFIHKNLKEFLNRELDFYIKNEVMWLDDIEDADAPQVETYLAKIKVIRKIAHKIIEFLSQLEEFQKKLWLKKKFVVETNYCITLDRVPEDLYKEIAANHEQREEWIKLFAIDKIKAGEGDMHEKGAPGYSKPLKVEFLKANKNLVLDTKFFNDNFKFKLISAIDNFDEKCDGVLIHSENFQALNLLQERYREQVKCVYIDPPYNTGNDDFLYKDNLKNSTWLSFLFFNSNQAIKMMSNSSVFYSSIGDKDEQNRESFYYCYILDNVFGKNNWVDNLIVVKSINGMGSREGFSTNHEYIITYKKNKTDSNVFRGLSPTENYLSSFDKSDEYGRYKIDGLLRKKGDGSRRKDSPNCFYSIYYNPVTGICSLFQEEDFCETIPKLPNGDDGRWTWSKEYAKDKMHRLHAGPKGTIYIKDYFIDGRREKPKSVLNNSKYLTDSATNEIKSLFYGKDFPTPKPIKLLLDIIDNATFQNSLILDYFAGSGTTGHAVINLNREDNGSRKYILIEMGDHFNTVLKPRIQKVAYSSEWKDGKPVSRDTGISHCFKYMRLESYEDTLNNLEFHENAKRNSMISKNSELREDFILKYMLDVETRGSDSILNIDKFSNPFGYKLKLKKAGSDEYEEKNIDLVETFNYLIGARITKIFQPENLFAKFKRERDPELPDDQNTKLILNGKLENREDGCWQIRCLEGFTPADRLNPNSGQIDKVLIIWRNLTGKIEEDNAILDAWFNKKRINPLDFEFNTIYVNGTNNLPNLKLDNETWKVRLIEEEFMKRMWEAE